MNPPPWQQSFNGLTWRDMPGTGDDAQKINFALWRRGMLARNKDGGFYSCQPNGKKFAEDESAEIEEETQKQPTPTIEPMKPNNQHHLADLEVLKETAAKKGTTLRQVALAMGMKANYFCPSSAVTSSNSEWSKRVILADSYLNKKEAPEAVEKPLIETMPPALKKGFLSHAKGPIPFDPEEISKASLMLLGQKQPPFDPLARIAELAQNIREMREEIRALAMEL